MNERTRSWIESASDPEGDFPIENLPLGVFDRDDAEAPRIGVPIGEQVLDLREAWVNGLLGGLSGSLGRTLEESNLNGLAALGRGASGELRGVLTNLLSDESSPLRTSDERDRILLPASAIDACMPFCDRRLHRLLRQRESCHQRRQDVPARW